MIVSQARQGPRISRWRTKPFQTNSKAIVEARNPQAQPGYFSGGVMIFASVFGSFVAIAVLQRLWPRKIEVRHRAGEATLEPGEHERMTGKWI